MFWNWLFYIVYCLGSVCATTNMNDAKTKGEKIFRMSIAALMHALSIFYGCAILIELLGI